MMVTWALTDELVEEQFDFRLCRNAAKALSTMGGKWLDRLCYSGSPLVRRLGGFLETRYAEIPVFCGHFQRIVEAACRGTQGRLLSDFPAKSGFLRMLTGAFGCPRSDGCSFTSYPTSPTPSGRNWTPSCSRLYAVA